MSTKSVHINVKSGKDFKTPALTGAKNKVMRIERLKKQVHARVDPRAFLKKACSSVTSLLAERKKLIAANSDFDSKYVLVDSKDNNPYADKLKINQSAIDSMRGMARNVFGNQKVRMSLYELSKFTTSAGGVSNGVLSVDPSLLTEFVSAANLFDEYKVVSGELSFVVASYALNGIGVGIDFVYVVAYDPIDNSVLTSTTQGCQHVTHKQFFTSMVVTGVTNPYIDNQGHSLKWTVPKGVLVQAAPTAQTAAGDGWQPTVPQSGTAYMVYGYMKAYAANLLPVSATSLSGIQTYHVEFRIRE
jgi:hypothetical protein